ncbi:MAG: class I SAM-dependent methyltransferase, partial [Nannocystaceae bacterium]|nr:class I SAM-dependent methyltransferase [Nannocystaceae bacterium]
MIHFARRGFPSRPRALACLLSEATNMTDGEVIRQSGWERWHDWQAEIMVPVTTWICDAVAARPGMTVLDAACGTGLPALALAERLRPGGTLIATDVSPVMLDAVRRKAAAAGLDHVQVRESSLASLQAEDASFDAVTCKDGLMYVPDPVDGARELRRVLAPGGRYAITVWDEPARCSFFRTMFGVVGRFLGPPADPRGPGPLRLSAPGVLEGVLHEAGFCGATIETREVVFTFDSFAMYWEIIREMAAPIAAAEAKLGPS